MILRKFLILRKPRSGCLEGRTALIQPIDNSFTASALEPFAPDGVFTKARRESHPTTSAARKRLSLPPRPGHGSDRCAVDVWLQCRIHHAVDRRRDTMRRAELDHLPGEPRQLQPIARAQIDSH